MFDLADREALLAPYACHASRTRGRRVAEPESLTRTPFQRDRDRIIHSTAFRRLNHKTQVFVYHEGDHYRTRLTHSIEVAQIARSLARALRLDEDLAEALALAHDFGHPPFGHAGEDALAAEMAPYGGFDHNAQAVRVVTLLETRYPDFDGLNLTWDALEGLAKHNGPLIGPLARKPLDPGLAAFNADYGLDLDGFASAEAQAAAIADDIAYNNHDIDDGLRAGLFELDELATVPLVGDLLATVRARRPHLSGPRLRNELVRELIGQMIGDVLANAAANLRQVGGCADVRALGRPVICFTSEMAARERELKAFLMQHMYRHYRVNRMASKARRVVSDLFQLYMSEPDVLPDHWRGLATPLAPAQRARPICDFIAGMTDRYALLEHQKLFDVTKIDL